MSEAKSRIDRLVRRWHEKKCNHRFAIEDIVLTGIPKPEQPHSPAAQEQWQLYFRELHWGKWHTERVEWPCADCGKIFRAHCGLDISPSNGPMFRREDLNT